MGKNIFLAGGPGAGQAAKICNNMMLAINMVGVSEGFLLAQKLGLDWDKLHAITSTATSQSWALSNYCPAPGPVPAAPSNRDYAPGFMAALMLKDVKLSQAAAEADRVADAARGACAGVLPGGGGCRRRRQGFFGGVPLAGGAETRIICHREEPGGEAISRGWCVTATEVGCVPAIEIASSLRASQ